MEDSNRMVPLPGSVREVLARINGRINGILLPIVGLGTAEKTVTIGGSSKGLGPGFSNYCF